MGFVTDEMRALIGVKSEKRTAAEPIGRDSLRRFLQATMDENPFFLSGEVAPPLYPVHAFRRGLGTPDPLDRAKEDREWDGGGTLRNPLPPLDLPLQRHLNAGSEIEFFQLATVGDVVSETSAYRSIEDKESSSGPIVVETVETEYTNQRGEPLLTVYRSRIHR
jgi:hypothetical protein